MLKNVLDRGERDPDNLLSCPHYLLCGLAVRSGAIPVPGSDAAVEDTFFGFSVTQGESLQKVETLLVLLSDGAGIEGPREVFHDVNVISTGC